MQGLKVLGLAVVLGALGGVSAHAQSTNADSYGSDSRFGAIAVADGQPLIYAAAANYTSPREASNAARRACQKKGGQGCQTAIGFETVCGAMASGTNGKWVAVKGPSRSEARDAVLAKCKDGGLDGCKVEIAACADDAS